LWANDGFNMLSYYFQMGGIKKKRFKFGLKTNTKKQAKAMYPQKAI